MGRLHVLALALVSGAVAASAQQGVFPPASGGGGTAGVSSFNGRTGAVTTTSADVPNNAANTTGAAAKLTDTTSTYLTSNTTDVAVQRTFRIGSLTNTTLLNAFANTQNPILQLDSGYGVGKSYSQAWIVGSDGNAVDSFAIYLNKTPNDPHTPSNSDYFFSSSYLSFAQGHIIGWSSSATGAGTALSGVTLDTTICRSAAGAVNFGTTSCNGAASLTAGSYTEALTTPASSSAACTAGQFTDDANFHYVCVATSQWKRVALSTF